MQNVFKAAVTVFVLTLLAGCASYTPPAPKTSTDNRRVVDANYDTTWTALIDYVSSTSFSIDNFEKESGLLTLSFGSGNYAQFVDCGTWTNGQPYIGRDLGFRLTGKMNMRVRSISAQETDVRISTRYILRDESGNVYDFTTDTPATVAVNDPARGTQATRTCQSSQVAEKTILTGIEAVSSR
jgi:hypothetical protein